MTRKLKIISNTLLKTFKDEVNFDLNTSLLQCANEVLPFDYFDYHNSVSSVYSSMTEGEPIEADSYLKHKFLKVKYEPDYTKRTDDLNAAYAFMQEKKLNAKNALKAHKLLSKNLLLKSQRGRIRINPMFVLDEKDRIEYVACSPNEVLQEWEKLFKDIKKLLKADLEIEEVFYYAAFVHLVFLKIHPMSDGNGRTARLIEKWFLKEKLGKMAHAVNLEKNYYHNKPNYYRNIRKVGLEYESLEYGNALDFLTMTVRMMDE
jgi:Fic family protein